MKIRLMLALLVVGALLTGVAEAGVSKEVSFTKGSNSTLIAASVVRGERPLFPDRQGGAKSWK